MKKTSLLAIALIFAVYTLLPLQRSHAAAITYFNINDVYGQPVNEIISGVKYAGHSESNKASTTSVKIRFEYSKDNGATWLKLPTYKEDWAPYYITFPLDPQLTSALIRVGAYFDPLIGSKTYSEKTIGPYKILQPIAPSDVVAAPNQDGTVTLSWNDNSNMESTYYITRYGPDGTKTFSAGSTTDHVGPLVFHDKNTNNSKSTIYVYSLTTAIDNPNMEEDLLPGVVTVTVKTRVLSATEKYGITPNISDKSDINKFVIAPDISVVTQPDVPNLKMIAVQDELTYTQQAMEISKNLWNEQNNNINDIVDKIGGKAVKNIVLDNKTLDLKTGQSAALTGTVLPENALNKNVAWSSDAPQVAAVNSVGMVTGISPGIAKIKATTEDGGYSEVCIVTVNPAEAQFTDTALHKSAEEIVKAVKLGIAAGYPDGTFRPDGNITRAEFATMLINGLKPEEPGSPLAFKDKSVIGAWAVPSVEKAVALGIISGYTDGTFRPNARITHSEMITMVVRASGFATNASQQTGFADDAEIPKWAKPAVSKAEETGIIIVGGFTDGKFAPNAPSTRAEAASAIVRMLQAKNKG